MVHSEQNKTKLRLVANCFAPYLRDIVYQLLVQEASDSCCGRKPFYLELELLGQEYLLGKGPHFLEFDDINSLVGYFQEIHQRCYGGEPNQGIESSYIKFIGKPNLPRYSSRGGYPDFKVVQSSPTSTLSSPFVYAWGVLPGSARKGDQDQQFDGVILDEM